MEERLIQFLQSEGINPTRFAERIGVQRSSISHILSGRNKPSYDFIIKILDSFPSVNPDWLLRGKGLMYKTDVPVQPSLFDSVKSVLKDTSEPVLIENLTPLKDSEVDPTISNALQAGKLMQNEIGENQISQEKKIEKIVILYSDKTFSDYHPNS
jgi:transcriptional regulator with XRE-family HTH domain